MGDKFNILEEAQMRGGRSSLQIFDTWVTDLSRD